MEDLAVEETSLQAAQRQTKAFSEHLRAHPTDAEAWLRYVRFQDTGVGSSVKADVVREKKRAILEQARRANPRHEVCVYIYVCVCMCVCV